MRKSYHIIQRQQILDPPDVFGFKTIRIMMKGTQTLKDIDADNSGNDEGDEDVNISANMFPPPPRLHPKAKRKTLNNQTANQVVDISADVLPPPPHPHPMPQGKAPNNINHVTNITNQTANQDVDISADMMPPPPCPSPKAKKKSKNTKKKAKLDSARIIMVGIALPIGMIGSVLLGHLPWETLSQMT